MKKTVSAIIAMTVTVSVMGQGIAATAVPTVSYTYINAEKDIAPIPDSALQFKNNTRTGVTATGMTKSTVYDEEKEKNVMQLAFKAKADSTGKSIDVLSSLDGLAALLTDGSANTISFDYKVTGTSTGNIAMFFIGKDATDLSDISVKYPAIGIRNQGGIAAFARPAANRSKWYDYISDSWLSHASDNTQWNRLTVVTDDSGKKISAVYINEETAVFKNPNGMGLITDGTTEKGEIDKILFNTEGAVTSGNGLAILLDDIKVYPGEIDFTGDHAFEGVWDFANGLKMKDFGLSDPGGAMVSKPRSDVFVKTKLSNLSEDHMKILVFVSGYKNGVMESVDFKLCDMDAGDELDINSTSNALSLDPAKEYDRIQLRIFDFENGYPLVGARELDSTE